METKTIKDIDTTTWAEFKSVASRSGVTHGQLFKRMLDVYDRESEEAWDRILNVKKILSDKEADEMQESVKKLRREYGFR